MAQEQEKDVIGARETAEFLGVSLSWLYNHVDEIPHRTVGILHLFYKPALREWLNRIETSNEPVARVTEAAEAD